MIEEDHGICARCRQDTKLVYYEGEWICWDCKSDSAGF